jgi:hypothetical protein
MAGADTAGHSTREELLALLAHAGVELAMYASYAEIVGAVCHNRTQVRGWCDEVFRLNHALRELDEATEGTAP